jgi:hypothetical protein
MRILMAQGFETASTNRLRPFSLSLEGGKNPLSLDIPHHFRDFLVTLRKRGLGEEEISLR